MDSPPPSSVLDVLEFDLTIEDSESEFDGCERAVAQVPSIAELRDQVLLPQTDREPGGVPHTGRFAALIDDPEFDPTIEDPVTDPVTTRESDTDTIDGQSEADPEAFDEVEPAVPDVVQEPLPSGHVSVGMANLDEVDLNTIFARRAHDMRSIPHFLKGPYRAAVRLAMREASGARETGDVLRLTRAWKLFLLLPRTFLSRPPRGGLVPKTRLLERVSLFHNGQWCDLVERSAVDAETAHFAACRKRRRAKSEVEQRASRALRCVLDGELSAGRQALEGAEVAPGTQETLNALRNSQRRPTGLRDPLPEQVADHVPDNPVSLDSDLFARTLRAQQLVLRA